MNISQIANRRAGGERAARTAHSTYWPCHHTMRTEMLKCRQRCRNHKVGTTVRLPAGWQPAGLCPVWVTHLPRQSGSGFQLGVEPNQIEPPSKHRTTDVLPGSVAYTTNMTFNRWCSVDAHFQDGAGSMLRSLLPIQGGNTSIMCIHYQIEFLIPDLQEYTSFRLCWRSFCHGRIRNMEPFTLA